MTTASQLLNELAIAGVTVSIAVDDPDTLDVDGPADVLTPWLPMLRRCKPSLLAALRSEGTASWSRRAAALLATIEEAERRTDLRDAFEERAAICEHDGGLSLDDAEKLAYEHLQAAMRVTT